MGWTNRQWDDYVRQQPGTFWGEYAREQSQRIKASRESSLPPAPASRHVERVDPPIGPAGASRSRSVGHERETSNRVSVLGWLSLVAMLAYARSQGSGWAEAVMAGIVAGVATYLGIKVLVFAVAVAFAVVRVVLTVALYGGLAIGILYIAYVVLTAFGS